MLKISDGAVISADTAWEGRVEVEGVALVPEGVTLTVRPGTVVTFRKSDKSYAEHGEGGVSEILIPGSGIRVEGKIIAEGEKGKEIIFTSAEAAPEPGDWGCILLDHSKGSVLLRCRIEYSAYTVHAHFSTFDISRCTVTKNEDGSRIGYSKGTIDHCDIAGNTGKALSFYRSKFSVSFCNINGNGEGIFLNEGDQACTFEFNNVHGNENMDLRLGEFHTQDISLRGNWWGGRDAAAIASKIYDKEDDPETGKAAIEPADAPVAGAGVTGPEFTQKWSFKTGGFVDSSAAVADGRVYFGSWDKKLYALDAKTGSGLWSYEAGDCVDSSPLVRGGRVFFGSWDRNLYGLDVKDGRLAWKFGMPPSNFDDHRQSSFAYTQYAVITGGFDGSIYALSPDDGQKLWEIKTGGPVRSTPYAIRPEVKGGKKTKNVLLVKTHGYAGSGDGYLYAFDYLTGGVLWKFKTGGAVNSSPAVDKALVYFGSQDGSLYCLETRSGRKVWSYPTGSRIEYSSPAITRARAIVGDAEGVLHAVDSLTGAPAWKFRAGGGIYSSPVVIGGRLFFGDNSGNVWCIDHEKGGLVALFRAGDAVQGISVGPDGAVYASSRDGRLYALSLRE
ncbi:MAG TPA: PQQ-binding-like beta-propeller repeat protein [Nitrospirota bacterium]|nr:PQQ-binding-like beta-propeller repeat protein [Nitrospirota bacterium]